MDSYFIPRYIIIKYGQVRFRVKSANYYESYGPFFNFIFCKIPVCGWGWPWPGTSVLYWHISSLYCLINSRKWLLVGKLDDRFLSYLVDLLHVRPKVKRWQKKKKKKKRKKKIQQVYPVPLVLINNIVCISKLELSLVSSMYISIFFVCRLWYKIPYLP